MACERLEVLDDGGQVELVASASETSQAHSLEAMMDLQVREAHLYFLTLMGTNPCATGSETLVNTIGMVLVTRCRAARFAVVAVTKMSGLNNPTRSDA